MLMVGVLKHWSNLKGSEKWQFNVALRNDLVVDGKPGIRGWKNVRMNQALLN